MFATPEGEEEANKRLNFQFQQQQKKLTSERSVVFNILLSEAGTVAFLVSRRLQWRATPGHEQKQ
eukprot:1161986-Pelagomonas_calceolata.AAC.3